MPVDFAALRSVSTARRPARSNLPAPVDRFVGRARELREVGERFARARLLTLLGSAGHAFTGDPAIVAMTANDVAYLCDAANRYFRKPVEPVDVADSGHVCRQG